VDLGLQFIASAPTLFPAEYVKEFQSCLDKTPAVPFNEIKAIIRQELGRPLEEVYDFIDPQPLASASVAQVQNCRGMPRKQKCVIVQ
jgi:aarF domain-containing kinase